MADPTDDELADDAACRIRLLGASDEELVEEATAIVREALAGLKDLGLIKAAPIYPTRVVVHTTAVRFEHPLRWLSIRFDGAGLPKSW